MKRIVSLLLMVCMLLSCEAVAVSADYVATDNEYYLIEYTVLDHQCARIDTFVTLQSQQFIVPEQVDGYTVTEIGDNAFPFVDTDGPVPLTVVAYIPETVQKMGNNVFSDTQITIVFGGDRAQWSMLCENSGENNPWKSSRNPHRYREGDWLYVITGAVNGVNTAKITDHIGDENTTAVEIPAVLGGCVVREVSAYGLLATGCMSYRSLQTVTIPRECQVLNGHFFLNCRSLRTVYYGGSKTDWAAMDISMADVLEDVTIYYAGGTDMIGDIDGNDKVNMSDVMLFFKLQSGGESYTEPQMISADYNGDGTVNMQDVYACYRDVSGN